MKPSRFGASTEFVARTKWAGLALEQFMYTNMPPEAEAAIDGRIVTPTITELVRLVGLEIDGQPPLTIDELIGPTLIGHLDPEAQAFYFTGPMHPVIVKARKLPTFVTYKDMLDVHGPMGIRKAEVTRNFRGLLKNLFEDEGVPTCGNPGGRYFEGLDAGKVPRLHRFAVRRGMAQMAMRGEYRVGIAGTTNTNVFNGYGRALIRAIYDLTESVRRLQLTMELEDMRDLVVDKDDSRAFQWGKIYKDSKGLGYRMDKHGYDAPVSTYITGLLREIGAIKSNDWWWKKEISEEAFVVAVSALCPLDKKHTRRIKTGHTCDQGVHCEGLTKASVRRAQTIATCITGEDSSDIASTVETDLSDINLLDPDLNPQASRSETASAILDYEW